MAQGVSFNSSDVVMTIVSNLKSQGVFDHFRQECLSTINSYGWFESAEQEVKDATSAFLSQQTWTPGMNKTQTREALRQHLLKGGYLDNGKMTSCIDDVVRQKILPLLLPGVEKAVEQVVGIKPNPHSVLRKLLEQNPSTDWEKLIVVVDSEERKENDNAKIKEEQKRAARAERRKRKRRLRGGTPEICNPNSDTFAPKMEIQKPQLVEGKKEMKENTSEITLGPEKGFEKDLKSRIIKDKTVRDREKADDRKELEGRSLDGRSYRSGDRRSKSKEHHHKTDRSSRCNSKDSSRHRSGSESHRSRDRHRRRRSKTRSRSRDRSRKSRHSSDRYKGISRSKSRGYSKERDRKSRYTRSRSRERDRSRYSDKTKTRRRDHSDDSKHHRSKTTSSDLKRSLGKNVSSEVRKSESSSHKGKTDSSCKTVKSKAPLKDANIDTASVKVHDASRDSVQASKNEPLTPLTSKEVTTIKTNSNCLDDTNDHDKNKSLKLHSNSDKNFKECSVTKHVAIESPKKESSRETKDCSKSILESKNRPKVNDKSKTNTERKDKRSKAPSESRSEINIKVNSKNEQTTRSDSKNELIVSEKTGKNQNNSEEPISLGESNYKPNSNVKDNRPNAEVESQKKAVNTETKNEPKSVSESKTKNKDPLKSKNVMSSTEPNILSRDNEESNLKSDNVNPESEAQSIVNFKSIKIVLSEDKPDVSVKISNADFEPPNSIESQGDVKDEVLECESGTVTVESQVDSKQASDVESIEDCVKENDITESSPDLNLISPLVNESGITEEEFLCKSPLRLLKANPKSESEAQKPTKESVVKHEKVEDGEKSANINESATSDNSKPEKTPDSARMTMRTRHGKAPDPPKEHPQSKGSRRSSRGEERSSKKIEHRDIKENEGMSLRSRASKTESYQKSPRVKKNIVPKKEIEVLRKPSDHSSSNRRLRGSSQEPRESRSNHKKSERSREKSKERRFRESRRDHSSSLERRRHSDRDKKLEVKKSQSSSRKSASRRQSIEKQTPATRSRTKDSKQDHDTHSRKRSDDSKSVGTVDKDDSLLSEGSIITVDECFDNSYQNSDNEDGEIGSPMIDPLASALEVSLEVFNNEIPDSAAALTNSMDNCHQEDLDFCGWTEEEVLDAKIKQQTMRIAINQWKKKPSPQITWNQKSPKQSCDTTDTENLKSEILVPSEDLLDSLMMQTMIDEDTCDQDSD